MVERIDLLRWPIKEPIPVMSTTFGEIEIGEDFFYWKRLGPVLYEKIAEADQNPNAKAVSEYTYPKERYLRENYGVYIEDLGFLICKLFSKMLP